MGFGRDRRGKTSSGTTAFDRIVRQARAGDQDAVSILYLNHVPMVYGYLRACGANDLDDLTSEVFVGMLRGLARFEGDQPAFRRWLMTIAHRRLMDHRRAGARNRIDTTEPSSLEALRTTAIGIEPTTALVDDELVAAFERLTDAQREVLALRFVADVSLRGVASITGRPTGAVKSLQNRGLSMLRQHLQVERERMHA